jgi:aminoglycoside phosphotransferase (APT) family kinase protein
MLQICLNAAKSRTEGAHPPVTAEAAVVAFGDAEIAGADLPVLLHGEDAGASTISTMAALHRLDRRAGLQDVVELPGGTSRYEQRRLIRAARHVISR